MRENICATQGCRPLLNHRVVLQDSSFEFANFVIVKSEAPVLSSSFPDDGKMINISIMKSLRSTSEIPHLNIVYYIIKLQ